MESGGNRSVAKPLVSKASHLVTPDWAFGTPELPTQCSGSVEPRTDAISNEGPLKLSKGRHDVEDEFSGRRGSVDLLLDRHEGSSTSAQVLQRFDQLPDRSSGAVEPLDDDGAESTASHIRHQLAEFEPVFLSPRCDVRIHGHELPTFASGEFTQLLELDVEVLLAGADPHVCSALH